MEVNSILDIATVFPRLLRLGFSFPFSFLGFIECVERGMCSSGFRQSRGTKREVLFRRGGFDRPLQGCHASSSGRNVGGASKS